MKLISLLFCFTIIFNIAALAQNNDLPVDFTGNFIFAQPVSQDGDTLHLFVDTGGIFSSFKNSAGRLELMDKSQEPSKEHLPPFVSSASIPDFPATGVDSTAVLQKKYQQMRHKLFANNPSKAMQYHAGDGVLAQDWFADRIWTFDYPHQKLIHLETYDAENTRKTPVYFRNDSDDRTDMHLPGIVAVVDGDTLHFFIDTGATLELKELVHEAFDDDQPRIRATSYITRSQFEEWYFSHPEWKIYEDVAKWQTSNMIRVPKVTIGGHTVGPVWFTTRPDNLFDKMFSPFTGRKVVGSLGGSLLKYFRFTIHYPDKYAVFEIPE